MAGDAACGPRLKSDAAIGGGAHARRFRARLRRAHQGTPGRADHADGGPDDCASPPDRGLHDAAPAAHDGREQGLRRDRGPDELWRHAACAVWAPRGLCGQDPERCEARRSAGGATHQVRVGAQSQDGSDARDHLPPDAPRLGGRGDSMTSITLIITLGLSLLLAPLASNAQPLPKVPRLGVLAAYSSTAASRNHAALRQGLHELGYVEGQTIILEERWAEGKLERLPDLAADLVRLQVDILVAAEALSARAARQATERIPIVLAGGDAVGAGLITNIAQPGGN